MKDLDEQLLRFLKDKSLKVAVIKGEWGIGKTYFWRKFLKSSKRDLDFRAYSYISLFGAKDISDLKHQVIANFEILDSKGIEKDFEVFKPIYRILKSVKIPFLSSTGFINELIEAKLLENLLICIDDLERKEKSISVSSVLGFISQLKEEKSCKFILIYNDQKIDEEIKEKIGEYREKIVDIEITYRPNIVDSLSIIWPEGCPQYVNETFHVLGLNNLRIMQRVKWTLEYFRNEIAAKYPNLLQAFETKCTILTVLYHAYSTSFTLDEILSTSFLSVLMMKDEKEKKRFDVLKKLNFIPVEQDSVIAEYLINGYVDFAAFHNLLAEKNERYRLDDINKRHGEIWHKYYSTFVTSQDKYIELETDFLKDNFKDLGLNDVSSAVQLIKELDPTIDLNPILEEAINQFVSKVDRIDRHDLQMLRMSPDVIKRIEAKIALKPKKYSMKELLIALTDTNGWNPEDLKYLLDYSEDDFFEWIKNEDSIDVIGVLKEFFSRFGNQNDNEKTVISRIRAALEEIKKRSNIDRRRIELILGNSNQYSQTS